MRSGQAVVVETVETADWAAIASQFADYNFEQSTDYAMAMAKRVGGTAQFFTLRRGACLIGAACVRTKVLPVIGQRLSYISGGPMTQVDDKDVENGGGLHTVLAALKQKLVEEDHNFLFVRFPTSLSTEAGIEASIRKLGFKPTQRLRSYETIVVDLSQSVEVLRQKLRKKWRYDLTRSEKNCLQIDVGNDERMCARFLKLYKIMRDKKEFANDIGPEFFFTHAAASTGLVVLIAKSGDEDIGGHVLSVLGGTAVYLFGATSEKGREKRAGYYLQWQAMLHAKECGCDWYDLAGIDLEANPGGYHFKSQMGGKIVRAIGPYEMRPSGIQPIIADVAIDMRQKFRRGISSQ